MINPFTEETLNAFCPTGEGGGIDPSCGNGGKKGLKLSTKSPDTMAAAQINKELDKLAEMDSKLIDEMIDSGRGLEKYTDWSIKTDSLSLRKLAVAKRVGALRHEVDRRTGGGMHRLPKGFGPIQPHNARV